MVKRSRGFGRRYAEDKRDARYRFGKRQATSARVYRYWNDTWYRGNQGQEPACVGFACGHWLANAPLRQLVDPYGLYKLAQHLDEWDGESYEGTSVRAGVKVLRALGFVERFEWTQDVAELAVAVLEYGPVILGTDWFSGMSYPDDRGFIHPTGEIEGGHAYLVNGVNRKRQVFRVLNSWEPDWCLNGRAWLSFADARTLLADPTAECCVLLEKQPRE